MTKNVNITPKKITVALLTIVMILFVLNLLMIFLKFVMGFDHVRGFFHGFYFDHEANLPSFYSSMAILLASGLLWLIGSTEEEKRGHRSTYWRFLSFVFIFLALDEFGSIHEILIKPAKALVARSEMESDYLYFAWFIPYTIVALMLGIVYFRFLLRLPSKTRTLFIVSAIVFMSGAVVMEMVGGKYWAQQGWAVDGTDDVDISYALIISVEELLEMLGIVIFIYALAGYYFARNEKAFLVNLTRAPSETSADSRP